MLSNYYLPISLGIGIFSLLIVYFRLDKHHTNVRRIVLISVMTALSICSRFVFAPIPAFKPMAAIIILTGMYLGPEAGFLCGSLTAFISNFYFGQGPWTPFQMIAFGLIGVFAALLSKAFKRYRVLLFIYAIIAGAFYSFFMDLWSMVWTYGRIGAPEYLAAIISAIPYTILYALSNLVFLLILEPPFSRKIGRIIIRYKI